MISQVFHYQFPKKRDKKTFQPLKHRNIRDRLRVEQNRASVNQPNNGFSQKPFEGASKRNTIVGRCEKTLLRLRN